MERQHGFTLIELMIVVAIIAIVAAIAIPAYQDYVARTQVSEGLVLATGAKTAVTEYYADRQAYPDDNVDAGLALPGSITGKYVTSITVGPNNGQIAVAFGNEASTLIAGQEIVMQLENHQGSLQWTCTGMDARYMPSICR